MTSESSGTMSTADFFHEIPDERAAIDYLENRRWPDGIIFPLCGDGSTTRQQDCKFHRCLECRKKFSVRTNTLYERPYVPLHKWLYVAYRFQNDGENIDSEKLSEQLDISERSAFFMLYRLREVCLE